MRGGIEFRALGELRTLRFSINAICRIEESTGKPIAELANIGANAKLQDIRAMFWGALEPQVTVEEAGEIMDELGLNRSAELIGEAFEKAFPEEADEAGSGKGSTGKKKKGAGA
ncbi:hypothetical protein GQE99_14470 [Maritimibacter sp. DP07]|uniref:Phage tail tube protein, GTA-gp10 n=1 Tax=Maritimibacter harenae TaxID=2606218 RepID=A0A845MAF6_9RHOB|nr:hypothetical protein [Maritimibacter harenae]MZR14224.1 hypothetical protein [Maritimibacter harenae]